MRCSGETLVASGFGYFVKLVRRRCWVNDGLSIVHVDPKAIGVWKDGELMELDYEWKASFIDHEYGIITVVVRNGPLEIVIRIRSNRIIDAFTMEIN